MTSRPQDNFFFLPCLLVALVAIPIRADDWPQWRGPSRDGVWRETGILQSIPNSGLKYLWRARVGAGYSGPAVANGRVIVSDHLYSTEVERVHCFDEATGKLLWTHSYPCPYGEMEYGCGPRATPTVHDGRVYTFGTKGHLFCLSAADGNVIWSKDLAKDFDAQLLRYGDSAAPLVVDDLLIVHAGGRPDATVIAFDRLTGEVRWKALKDRPAYSAPILLTAGGTRQLIVWTADNVNSFEPATGKVYWQVPYKVTFDEAQVVATPVLFKDRLLCMAAWNRGSFMLQLDATKPAATVLWKTRSKPTTNFSTPIFADDKYFYGVENDGSLCGFDAATGDQLWTTADRTIGRKHGFLHITAHGDRVFLFNQSGNLILARLTAKGIEELGSTLLVEPTAGYRAAGYLTWSHPAYANKCIYARNDRELICASLAADDALPPLPPSDAPPSRPLGEFTDYNAAQAIAWSPDGRTLALGTWAGKVKLLDAKTVTESAAPAGHNDWVCAVAFSPDGRLLCSAGGSEFRPARNGGKPSGQVKLFDRTTNTERPELAGHTSKVMAAAFSPDGKVLATAGADKTIRLWDPATGKLTFTLEGHADAVRAVVFAKDSASVISAGDDHTVNIWSVASGKRISGFIAHDEEVLSLAISPDGATLATGSADWTVKLWDMKSHKQKGTLKGHQGTICSLGFSPDGATLASGSGDQTIKLWTLPAGAERLTLRAHQSAVCGLAFSPDGQTLGTAGREDAARLWDLRRR